MSDASLVLPSISFKPPQGSSTWCLNSGWETGGHQLLQPSTAAPTSLALLGSPALGLAGLPASLRRLLLLTQPSQCFLLSLSSAFPDTLWPSDREGKCHSTRTQLQHTTKCQNKVIHRIGLGLKAHGTPKLLSLDLRFAQLKALRTFHWLWENLAENLRNFLLTCYLSVEHSKAFFRAFIEVSWPRNHRVWGVYLTYFPGIFTQYKTWGTLWIEGYWSLCFCFGSIPIIGSKLSVPKDTPSLFVG